MFISKLSTQKAFTLKSVLKCFELAFGFKINFNESMLRGLRVEAMKLKRLVAIMNCRIMNPPFIYPIGENYKRKEFWQEIISKITKRLVR